MQQKAERNPNYETGTTMKTIFTRKHIGTAVMCAMAMGAATAQSNPEKNAFVLDQRSGVVKSGFGLCWHSGTGPAPASTAECGSNYVVPPMAKSEAAPKPVTQRVTLDADTLFDFNKADLRPAGRDALDDFVGKTKDITPEVITAVGHADRFGSESYNMELSAQRAAAVKTYLLSKGIESNRISTEGRGETQPVTKAGDCLGARSKAVIECLQGDRRVDIEVVGSRIVR
jgi:OOP family OmpA-OmpF porin